MRNSEGVPGSNPSVRAGSILVQASTQLPASLAATEAGCFPGWNLLKDVSPESFTQEVEAAGWKLFYIGEEISLSDSGWSGEAAVTKLLKRVARIAEQRQCNCFQLIAIEVEKALFFANVRMDAQARHVQKGFAGVAQGVTP